MLINYGETSYFVLCFEDLFIIVSWRTTKFSSLRRREGSRGEERSNKLNLVIIIAIIELGNTNWAVKFTTPSNPLPHFFCIFFSHCVF